MAFWRMSLRILIIRGVDLGVQWLLRHLNMLGRSIVTMS